MIDSDKFLVKVKINETDFYIIKCKIIDLYLDTTNATYIEFTIRLRYIVSKTFNRLFGIHATKKNKHNTCHIIMKFMDEIARVCGTTNIFSCVGSNVTLLFDTDKKIIGISNEKGDRVFYTTKELLDKVYNINSIYDII